MFAWFVVFFFVLCGLILVYCWLEPLYISSAAIFIVGLNFGRLDVMPSLMGTSQKHSCEKDNAKAKHTPRKSSMKIHF
jgi:hypothetical protein